MRKRHVISLVLAFALVFFGLCMTKAHAGAKIKISDDTNINLGWRVQALFLSTDELLTGSSFDTKNFFKMRRVRFRLGANVTKWVSTFIQTETGVGGNGMKIIDAFIKVKFHPWFNLVVGQNMAPSTREVLTSSGGMLAADRPGITTKNLTWGLRSLGKFSTATLSGTDDTLTGGTSARGSTVRDLGATLFGSGAFPDSIVSAKYYLGIYDGQNISSKDSERYAARVQINIFDPEPGYYNLATYLGKKKTIAIGFSYDAQSDVGFADGTVIPTSTSVDYAFYDVDLHVEYPVGAGSITFEGAYHNLDLDNGSPVTEGDGYYFQAGYFINNFQPWAEYEKWSADAAANGGDYDAYRIGLSYFLKGHNANVKIGYENISTDYTFSGTTSEDSIGTFLVGLYVTY